MWRRLGGEQRGATMAMIALAMPLFIAMAGLVVDSGVMILERLQLESAVESAATAATDAYDRDQWHQYGRVVIDATRAQQLAQQYLAANMPEAQLEQVTVGPPNTVLVRAQVTAPLYFMRIFGVAPSLVEAQYSAKRSR